MPIEFDDDIVNLPVIWGETIRVVNCLTKSRRWKHRRQTNRRLRQCPYNSPRWKWLHRDMVDRWERWDKRKKELAKLELFETEFTITVPRVNNGQGRHS